MTEPKNTTDDLPKEPTKKDYAKYRREVVKFLESELLGPSDEEEILGEGPVARYSTGVLFPQTKGQDISSEEVGGDPADPSEEIAGVEYSASYYPSAMGLSFVLPEKQSEINVRVTAAKYVRLVPEDAQYVSLPYVSEDKELTDEYVASLVRFENGKLNLRVPVDRVHYENVKTRITDNARLLNAIGRLFRKYTDGWKRQPIEFEIRIPSNAMRLEQPIAESGLTLQLRSKLYSSKGLKLCTLSLINTEVVEGDRQNVDDDKTYFQPKLVVTSDGSNLLSLDAQGFNNDELEDDEEKSLHLLYRGNHHFAVGHGVSVDWPNVDQAERINRVETTYLPEYEIPGVSFEVSSSSSVNFSMKFLEIAETDDLIKNLVQLSAGYEKWIQEQGNTLHSLQGGDKSAATVHINYCNESMKRIKAGVALLEADETVLRAFRLANRAMRMQREQTNGKEEPSWRPFQLAFILQSLTSVDDPTDAFRDVVDLIWFPTGGGKTEAYLGITAYIIFLRRLRNDDSVSGGTTVIMRYTLRLLTSQQFQRACTLICACEYIRLSQSDLGTDQISIGLWLGSDTTPNSVQDAKNALRDLSSSRGQNKFQVLVCPWCSTSLVDTKRRTYCYRAAKDPATKKDRILIYCPSHECPFAKGLPILVVDEDIYASPPTLLFGTVDKFARLPWTEKCGTIFASDPGNKHLPPDLIIQDELHLISGSLGTMVGVYETAIDILCSRGKRRPKIIASTATIRRAKEQAKQLYAREVRQFPAPGLSYKDSYFSRIVDIDETHPGRLYVGLMPSGKSSTTFQVRLMASAIQVVDYLPGPIKVKDQYWTFVTYCNSIRELGSSNSILLDDVVEYSGDIIERISGGRMRAFQNSVEELTSRKDSEEIPEILQKLEIEYTGKENNWPISVLLATNMLSVGIDINRLGMMMVLGQPKTTSEYIQASSRVGRRNPGLVLTQFSPSKSRDRSHFEKFKDYHQSIYRWVEPTSVTPFSEPALDRAIHAVLVALIRHQLHANSPEAIKSVLNDPEMINHLKQQIIDRAKYIEPDAVEQTEARLDDVINLMEVLDANPKGLVFTSAEQKDTESVLLRDFGEKVANESIQTANSMRSTDSQARLEVSYEELS